MPSTTHFGQPISQALGSPTPSTARPHVPQALMSLLYRIRACQKQSRARLNMLQADMARSRPFRSGPLAGDLAGLKQIMEDFDKWAWLMVNAIRHVNKYGYDMWVLTNPPGGGERAGDVRAVSIRGTQTGRDVQAVRLACRG